LESLDDLVQDELGQIQTFRGAAITRELRSKRPRQNVVCFAFVIPSGGREPNAHPLGKNALQVHSLRHDVARSARRVNKRSHQELGGGVIGDEDLGVLAVGQTPRRRSDRLDGVDVDANVTVCGVPAVVGVGVELHSHGLEGVVGGGAVEKT